MILLVTNRRDVTTDFVVAALRRTGAHFVRLNTEDLLRSWMVTWRTSGWYARDDGGRAVDSNAVQAVYYRRPQAPHPLDGTASDAGPFVVRECSAMLHGMLAHLQCLWISNPDAIERAEDKLLQLRVADTIGFVTPKTLVTNAPEDARAFVSLVGDAIVKPLSSGHLADEPARISFTDRVDPMDALEDIALVPHLLQERITKVADVRVTVVNDRIFACRIDSQRFAETALDWRTATLFNLRLDHAIIELPRDVKDQCVQLVRALGLRFGAIDLIQRPDGFTFLEINANGQWAWIEQRTGASISVAIAEALLHSKPGTSQ